MALNNAIRLISFGLSITLVATTSGGQTAPNVSDGAQQNGTIASAPSSVNMFMETPPKPPKVTCNGDRLAISAQNSTLGSVLVAVRNCLGVQIDIPDGSGGEARTYDQIGPGPVREVLESLLDATDFNYVIGSSLSNPEKVETVLLMLRDKDAKATASTTTDLSLSPKRRAWLEARQTAGVAGEREEENRQAMAGISSASPSEEAVPARLEPSETNAIQGPPPPPAPSPSPVDVGAPPVEASPAAAPDASASSPQVKETANKINAMQQMFEQRAKMIESQNSTSKQ